MNTDPLSHQHPIRNVISNNSMEESKTSPVHDPADKERKQPLVLSQEDKRHITINSTQPEESQGAAHIEQEQINSRASRDSQNLTPGQAGAQP